MILMGVSENNRVQRLILQEIQTGKSISALEFGVASTVQYDPATGSF
jgi:hypothetical protein